MDGQPRERAPGESTGGGRPLPTAAQAPVPTGETSPDAVPHWQEVADALWLAVHWAPAAGSGLPPDTGPDDAAVPPDPARPTRSTPLPRKRPERPGRDTEETSGPLPLPDPEGAARIRLGPPRLPDRGPGSPRAGRFAASLAQALHRLARRVPSPHSVELDEETTAERGLTDGLWMPWLRPADVTAFDLVLLVDEASTMTIWQGEAASLATAAEHSGAFRAVRTLKLTVPRDGGPRLRWSGGHIGADLGELLDVSGKRLFLVLTDGLAPGWAGSSADTLLDRLGRAGPTALLHLLPPHLRHRTSLYPHSALLEAGGFGAANRRLTLRPPPSGPDPLRPLPETDAGTVPVPVLSLKPKSIASWTDLVNGEPGVRRTLPVVLPGTLANGLAAPGLVPPAWPRAAASAVRRFFTLASPAARRLATQLAVIPFEFDLIDQLRTRTMPDTEPEHLAEILMGGLIDWGGPGGQGPEFAEGVREALLATTTRTQLAQTVSLLEALPAAGRHGVELRAALRDPSEAVLPDPADRGWHRSELAVMRALAGPYTARARRIEAAEPVNAESGDAGTPADLNRKTPSIFRVPEDAHSAAVVGATGHPDDAAPRMEGKPMGTPALLVNVPLRNTSFVGRQALLRNVEQQLTAQDSTAVLPHALHGLGGVGKSQLALEYIYTHQHDYKVICWIPAERESLVLAGLTNLAAQLGLDSAGRTGGGPPTADSAVPAVLEALRTGAPYDNWLLVFDNAEHVEVVRKYFPSNGPGKVIITSRNRAWERVATPLPVDVFEREESIELLQKRSPDLTPRDADRLAEALGDLPLAVEQAGAWRAVTGMQVDEYLELLEQRSPEILELDPAPDYPVSVAAAWDISLDRIKDKNPGARQLLDICASLAPEPIPRSMLRGSRGLSITPEVDPLLRESIKLNRAIRDLSQFSLVRVDPRSGTLQMHRMLQTVLLAKLSSEARERMRDAGHQLLSAAKPGQYASPPEWQAYQALLPHILTSQAVTSADTWVRELVNDTVLFLYYWGDYQGAAQLGQEAWNAWLATSGEEDIQVVRMTKHVAFLLRVVGRVAESIPLTEKALEVSRRTEVEPEDLVDSLCATADARRYQGRFQEAQELSREAVHMARERFGPDDPTTLWATHSWGVDLRLCGEFRHALQLDRETARQREILFGPDNFFTLNSLNALAIDMLESGDHPGAREFQEDVHRRARSALGELNPLSLRIARNLAVCRRRDGSLTEAARLSEETLVRFTARYGPDHVDSLSTAVNVCVDRRLTGDFDGSRRLADETAQRYARLLGDDHAYTLLTRAALAATLRTLGDLEAAAELEDDAARRLAATAGPRHITALTVALGRAGTAYARLDFERARDLDETVLPLLAEVAGPDHPLTASCTANLSLDLRGMGRGGEADELQRTALTSFTRSVRTDHPWLLAARQRRRVECDLTPMPL
ncbi:FxSxx-COOH system tetratricopeptide repeat protein [Streptomyces sp. NPDC057596]|uniref:FxSxx-COOH system tetratricopeptide repeat protein n=1 Tax=Streptomyces sp. NPDC057596 TaxID=3346178 RepID=UPI00368191A0